MAGKRNSRSSTPKYSRSARVSTTLQEIIADELVRIDDERLTFVTVTGIDVDPELNRAIVFFDSLAGEEGDEEILEAFADHRDPAAGVDRPADPGEEDADPRLPSGHGDPLRRSYRRHPPKSDQARIDARRRAPSRSRDSRRDRGLMARRRPATTHGMVVVDKPAGVTSHDVVGMLRRRFGERQVGHAGTLDPGRDRGARRRRRQGDPAAAVRREDPQGLHGEVVLGTSTSTLDSPVTCVGDVRHVRRDARRCPSGCRRRTWSATSNRSRRWCRRSVSTASVCTNSPERASRSSERPGR